MCTYRMSDEYMEQGRTALLNKLRIQYTLVIALTGGAVALALANSLSHGVEFHLSTYLIGVPALAAIIVISLRDNWSRGLGHLEKSAQSYRLTVEPGRITCIRTQQPRVVLQPKEILQVQESGAHGLHLCTADPRTSIRIPRHIENYADCKNELRAQGLRWTGTE
jgi:hypothetical protein